MSRYSTTQALADGWADAAGDFAQYMDDIDASVGRQCGLGRDDFPDHDFAAAFTAGESPTSVANEILAEAGWPGGDVISFGEDR